MLRLLVVTQVSFCILLTLVSVFHTALSAHPQVSFAPDHSLFEYAVGGPLLATVCILWLAALLARKLRS